MGDNQLFNISESLREDTSNIFLNQPPQHMGDSCCEEEIDDEENSKPGFSADSFLATLQKAYKQHRSVPLELLSSLHTEGMRALIENLISESLTARFHKESRKSGNSSDSESDYRLSNNFSGNSMHKQAIFPTFKCGTNDEFKTRRNNNISTYQKVEVVSTSQESYSVIPIPVKLPQPEQHDQTVIKLLSEISEAKNTKNLLLQVIRLSPNKVRLALQTSQILKNIQKHKQTFSGLLQESGKVRIFSQLLNFSKKTRKKQIFIVNEDEVQLIKAIFEVFDTQNLRNFRGYAYGLMKEHEAAEITKILVKHASWVEINTFGEMLLKVACLKQVLEHQENVIKEVKEMNVAREKEIKELQVDVKNLSY
jgi:hypothetical protein